MEIYHRELVREYLLKGGAKHRRFKLQEEQQARYSVSLFQELSYGAIEL